ncbi:unnamed protein product, partial [Trichogramma brassicae]
EGIYFKSVARRIPTGAQSQLIVRDSQLSMQVHTFEENRKLISKLRVHRS